MPANTTPLWLAVAELVLKYGLPAIKDIISTWNIQDENELKDAIQKAQAELKRPEDYFKQA